MTKSFYSWFQRQLGRWERKETHFRNLSLPIPQLYLGPHFHPFFVALQVFLVPFIPLSAQARFPQWGWMGGTQLWWLHVGGGIARAKVLAGLSGKLQEPGEGEMCYTGSWLSQRGSRERGSLWGSYGVMGEGKKPWATHLFLYLLPTELPWFSPSSGQKFPFLVSSFLLFHVSLSVTHPVSLLVCSSLGWTLNQRW